jgi:hypothetical protein
MRHSLGIQDRWHKAKNHWHLAIATAGNDAEIEDETIAFLTAKKFVKLQLPVVLCNVLTF